MLFTKQDVNNFLWDYGLSDFNLSIYPAKVNIYINHYWFRLGKLKKLIDNNRHVTIEFNIIKISFFNWMKMKIFLRR